MLKKTVLLVEDDEDNSYLISMMLERAGAQVQTAGTVERALELAVEPFDVVVSDIHLPDGNGTELLARWPATTAKPAAVALTGDADGDAQRRLRAAGFDLVLQKPLLPEVLIERVRELLASSNP
ncbi:MAG: response regulator [Polyangiaceae bacterium]|nr:response regulator [Polyangiaceae bacterium]